MFKKYITIQIVPSTSKKVKKIRISQFTSLLFAIFFAAFIIHTIWVFIAKNYFSQKSLYNYTEIKKNYEEKKLFLDQYEKSITDLKEKIAELRYDYDLLKNESFYQASKKLLK